jgi:hypothetical protein
MAWNQSENHTELETMLMGEFVVMAGSFAVLFAILLCGIKPERERRPRKTVRNRRCICGKCR